MTSSSSLSLKTLQSLNDLSHIEGSFLIYKLVQKLVNLLAIQVV